MSQDDDAGAVRPLRLLVVTNMYPTTGSPVDGIFIKRQIDALVSAGSGIEVEVCYVDTVHHKHRYLTGALSVYRAAQRFRPDIVHIHYGLTQLLCWPLRSAPTVITFHGSDLSIRWQRRISLALLKGKTRVVVVTENLKQWVDSAHSVTSIPCGVDWKTFRADRKNSRQRFGIDANEIVLLFGSHPDRQVKRYDRFLEVVELLRASIPSLTLRRLSDVSVSEVPQLMACTDVLLLTSDREGSPVVTKEALCSGARVVSTPVGDVSEQIHGFSGCRVSDWTAKTLAEDVFSVLSEPPPDRAIAVRRFGLENEVSSLLRIYRSMVN